MYYYNPYIKLNINAYMPGIFYPQSGVNFLSENIYFPYDYSTLLEEIKDLDPAKQITIIKEGKNELKNILNVLYLGNLSSKALLGLSIWLAKKAAATLTWPNILIAVGTPLVSEAVSQVIGNAYEKNSKLIEDFDNRIDELEDEIEKKLLENIKIYESPTPLAYVFINSLENKLNTFVAYNNTLNQKQSQLDYLIRLYSQSKTEKEKENIQVRIDTTNADIERTKAIIEGLNDEVMTVVNEALDNYSLNSQSPAKIGPQYYPWIFELNNKIIELEDANYALTDEAIRYISPILGLAEDIANESYASSNQLDVFEKKRWAKAIENLQPLFDIAKQ